MCPSAPTVGSEVFTIATFAQIMGAGFRFGQLVGNAIGARISDGRIFAGKPQFNLCLRVISAGPTHQRVNAARSG